MSNVYTPLRILNFANFLQYQRFVMPISFLFYLHNGLNFSDFILFQSIFNMTCLLAKIPMGYLGDIFPKKYILITSYLLFMLRVILWIFFRGFWIILAGEVLYGLFKALYRGNVDSYIYEYLEECNIKNKMITRYGKLSAYTSIGSAISCLAGVALYKTYGFMFILIAELLLQIIAVVLLFFIPNIKTQNTQDKFNLSEIKTSIVSIISNTQINFYVYYSALLTGLTGVFVWNFQPLLKASSAPIILFGIISFINQIFRSIGGFCSKIFVTKINENQLIKAEYTAVLLSFAAIIFAYKILKYIPVCFCILLICFAIMLFVIFNIFTISKIHDNTQDYNRATISSTNTFFGDFLSFILLLVFKLLYDAFGITKTLILFLILFAIIMFPLKTFNKNS